MRRICSIVIFFCLTLTSLFPARAQPTTISWDAKKQGAFIVSLAAGSNDDVWAGTEDKGVWRWDAKARKWQNFTAKDGLGDDDAYAVACDKVGRVWVGHLNHGVSVWNGKAWRNYDVMQGLAGERVFAITVSPLDGDVWIATDHGLSRYRGLRHEWQSYTVEDGLPSNQSDAIAFDGLGNLYVGTQCDGLALASAGDDFATWRAVRGPERLPVAASGAGLPSSLVNDVLVAGDDTVYVATPCGLARSSDFGETWSFLRGIDWEAKAKGTRPAPDAPALAAAQDASHNLNRELLREDYVTNLAEDERGLLWLGYRQKGYEIRRPLPDRVPFVSAKNPDATFPYVSRILPRPGQAPLVASYGQGLAPSVDVPPFVPNAAEQEAAAKRGEHAPLIVPVLAPGTPLPDAAPLPTLAELNTLRTGLAKIAISPPHDPTTSPPLTTPPLTVTPLDDDWRTQGTWLDRYGNFAAVLCAMGGGGNDFMDGYRASWFARRAWMGPNHAGKPTDDYLRYYVSWPKTDDMRTLQNSLQGGRKQSEWDDHGETLPMSLDGPHVYCTFKLPPGAFVVSCYFFNKDGHTGMNRSRDYLVELESTPMEDAAFKKLGQKGVDAQDAWNAAPAGARSRVHDFWGGVWKRFLIDNRSAENGTYTLKINRNYSFNTILSGVFVDAVGALPIPAGPGVRFVAARQERPADDSAPADDLSAAALRLMDRVLTMRDGNPAWYAAHSRRFLVPLVRVLGSTPEGGLSLARQIEATGKNPTLRADVAECLNDLQWFDARDRVFFDKARFKQFAWAARTKAGTDWRWDQVAYRAWSQAGPGHQAVLSW